MFLLFVFPSRFLFMFIYLDVRPFWQLYNEFWKIREVLKLSLNKREGGGVRKTMKEIRPPGRRKIKNERPWSLNSLIQFVTLAFYERVYSL